MSFSDQNLSVVCRCRRRYRRCCRFKCVQMMGPALFQGEIFTKIDKKLYRI